MSSFPETFLEANALLLRGCYAETFIELSQHPAFGFLTPFVYYVIYSQLYSVVVRFVHLSIVTVGSGCLRRCSVSFFY